MIATVFSWFAISTMPKKACKGVTDTTWGRITYENLGIFMFTPALPKEAAGILESKLVCNMNFNVYIIMLSDIKILVVRSSNFFLNLIKINETMYMVLGIVQEGSAV